jgi:hypothetical protein
MKTDHKPCDCNTKRYRVVKGSESAHCCFEATVVDTTKEVVGHYDWICECFDLSRAHAIADAMNAADGAPLNEKTPEPVYQDRCGKEFDVLSALLYFPDGKSDPMLVLPCHSEYNTNTGRWTLHVKTLVDSHPYLISGYMFKKNSQLLKLEASGDDVQTI